MAAKSVNQSNAGTVDFLPVSWCVYPLNFSLGKQCFALLNTRCQEPASSISKAVLGEADNRRGFLAGKSTHQDYSQNRDGISYRVVLDVLSCKTFYYISHRAAAVNFC